MAEKSSSSFHPAQTVHNIKNLVPLTLDLQRVQYHTWAELFQVAARAHNVIDHIDDPKISPPDPDVSALKWKQLDAIVLSWIYGTISEDLLLTIIKPGSTARDAWLRVKNLFHDNKSARAADLDNQFNHINLENYPNVTAYCQQLKSLADQLKDVDETVSDQRLVLQLINGLTPAFDSVGSIISHMNPLPDFLTARSMLVREETRRNRSSGSSVFVASSETPSAAISTQSSPQINSTNGGRNNFGGRNNNKRRNNSRNNRGVQQQQTGVPPTTAYSPRPPPGWVSPYQTYWPSPSWVVPPCPYPTAAPRPYNNPSGLLGPGPRAPAPAAQAYSVDTTPTDIQQAFSSMSFQHPDDSWYMDTGASSHMAANRGKLQTFFNSSPASHVLVGNGSSIPVQGSGIAHLTPTLSLSNIHVTPHIIKNLVSVRKFTSENNVSVEFDPLGFSVKDLRTGAQVMRCNSNGDLYPVIKPSLSPPVSLAVISSQLWHHRLGHPGDHVSSFLRKNNFISCNKETSSSLCSSCEIAKHKRLPFHLSHSVTYSAFDIIHSDLWTSPVLSGQGHRYYLVLLDDFTH